MVVIACFEEPYHLRQEKHAFSCNCKVCYRFYFSWQNNVIQRKYAMYISLDQVLYFPLFSIFHYKLLVTWQYLPGLWFVFQLADLRSVPYQAWHHSNARPLMPLNRRTVRTNVNVRKRVYYYILLVYWQFFDCFV